MYFQGADGTGEAGGFHGLEVFKYGRQLGMIAQANSEVFSG